MADVVNQNLPLSNIFGCPGLELRNFAVDQMHSGELGPLLDALGSLLWVEVTTKMWHRTKNAGLRAINSELELYYSANKAYSPLRLSMTQLKSKTTPYPILKAKAAQAKHLCKFGLVLAHKQAGALGRRGFEWRPSHRLHNRGHEYRTLIVQLFAAIVTYYDACDADEFVADRCIQPMYVFLQTMVQLHDLWCSGLNPDLAKYQPFHNRPKMHMLQHLVEDQLQLFGAPRNSSCYLDENFIGVLKLICGRSKHPKTIERVAMEKIRLGAGVAARQLECDS